ncbi:MAG: tetratricopeptide repeat protein [Thermoanaerobaculia bacterium]
MILLPLLLATATAVQTAAAPAASPDQDHSKHSHAAAPAAPAASRDPSHGSAVSGQAGLEVKWADTWDEAVREAKKLPKGRIIVDLVEDNCGECDRMDKLVIPSTSFYAFTKDKIPVRLLRSSEDGKRIAAQFGINQVPAWLVLTTDSVLCGLLVGSESQTGWFNNFIETEKHWATYQQKLEQEQKSPGDRELVFQVAEESFKRGSVVRSESRFRRLAEDQRVTPEMRDTSLSYLAIIELEGRRIPEAARDLEQILKVSKDPKLRERAELRLADVEIARARLDLAVERLRRFKKDHPASPFVAEANELLTAVEQHMARKPQ